MDKKNHSKCTGIIMSAAVLKHLNISTNLVKYILSSGLLPPANEVWCKVKFLVASVILSGMSFPVLLPGPMFLWGSLSLVPCSFWESLSLVPCSFWGLSVKGGLPDRPLRQRCPLDRGPPGQRLPKQRPHGTDNPLDRDPQTETSPGTVKSG